MRRRHESSEGSGFSPCKSLEKSVRWHASLCILAHSKEKKCIIRVSAFFSYFRYTLYFARPNQPCANLAFLLGLVDLRKDTVKRSIKIVLEHYMLIIKD